jgi:hypothetical protein
MAGLDVLRGLFNKDGEQGEETPPTGKDERSAFIRAQMAEGKSLKSAEDLWTEKAKERGNSSGIMDFITSFPEKFEEMRQRSIEANKPEKVAERAKDTASSSLENLKLLPKMMEYSKQVNTRKPGEPLPEVPGVEGAAFPTSPQAAEGRRAFELPAIVGRALPTPSEVPQAEATPAPKTPGAAVPAAEGEDALEAPQAPKNAPEMTALQQEIEAMATAYGKHGEALKAESDSLMSQLADVRKSYDESVKMARTDYEEAKARQQWAQVAEIIGRSLVGLVAAKRSLQKGRDFTQGLDPRSQVDWLGQLRESRADLQEQIDAAKREFEGEKQLLEGASKGRETALKTSFEGQEKKFGERIRELRQAEGRQYEEGRTAEQRAWQEKRDDRAIGKQQTAQEQSAMRMQIQEEARRTKGAAPLLRTELSKALSQKEGKLREEGLRNLKSTYLGDEPQLQAEFDSIVRENSNALLPDVMDPNYDSARVARARGALESVLRKSQVFKEASTPKVTAADYQNRFGTSGEPPARKWTQEDAANAEEIEAPSPEFKSGQFIQKDGKLYKVK